MIKTELKFENINHYIYDELEKVLGKRGVTWSVSLLEGYLYIENAIHNKWKTISKSLQRFDLTYMQNKCIALYGKERVTVEYMDGTIGRILVSGKESMLDSIRKLNAYKLTRSEDMGDYFEVVPCRIVKTDTKA
jgi:hypothetical protein